jgi:hypothetical protein
MIADRWATIRHHLGASMRARSLRLLTIAALVAASTTALGSTAGATPGTFTEITTPSGATKTIQFKGPPTTTTLTVSGHASSDVTSVDVDCILVTASGPSVTVLGAAVPVTGNAFSDVVTIPNLIANCRLRAVPSGVDAQTDYLGAYSGPILYMWGVVPLKDGSTTIAYQAVAERGDGIALTTDATSCGPALIATVAPPTMTVLGVGGQACTFALPSGNVTASGTSTASSIKVSGHNAYLPGSVSTYLRGTRSLTLPQPALTTSTSRASNGDLTITESAPLRRCSGGDLYPPTSVSCPSLTGTGVTFTRVTSIIRGSHQVRVRDKFTSTDGHAHPVSLQYQSQAQPADAGEPGYLFPGHAHFVTTSPDQVLHALGTRAATVFIRSDIHAFDGEQSADTRALTWSRAPSKIQFSHDSPTRLFATPYALNVPTGGNAYVGFALSDANRTSEVKPLAGRATDEMMNAPTITSPANHAHLHGHSITVKGGVTRGANGLPTSVSVNGHTATLTVVSAAKATYKVTFSLPFGTHAITAKATDTAHNTRSRSITVQNTA